MLLKAFALHIVHLFASLGGVGLFLFGIIDSSFLFFPLGIDLLMVGLTARHHDRMLYYASMCAAGSVVGCFTTDWLSRKGGEAGLKGRVSPRRLAYVEKHVRERGGVALAIASVMPPGFPFTPFIVVAAALHYPRAKLLGIIAVFRFVRFTIEGVLALYFGRRILQIADRPEVQYGILALVVISMVGSVWSLYTWFRKGKRA